MTKVSSNKDLIVILLVIDQPQLLREAVLRDHRTGSPCCLTDILRRTCRHIADDQLLRRAASEADHDLLEHPPLRLVHLILLRKRHRISGGASPGRNDRNRMHRPDSRKHMEQNGVSGFVIGRDPPVLLGHHPAMLLRSDADPDEGLVDILLGDVHPVILRRQDGGLVHQVLEIRSCKADRRAGDRLQIHIVRQRLVLCVDTQNLLPAAHVRPSDRHLAVKAPCAQQCRIQDIHPVCRRHDDDPLIGRETVHLHEQLVERLLPLIMPAAHAGSPAAADRINLIDEDDAGLVFLCFRKQIPDAGCADTDKHFHKIRPGNGEEGDPRLSCHGSCQKRLAGTRRADKQNTLGNSRAKLQELLRFPEELDDLSQIFLFLLQSGYIGKCRLLCVRHEDLCTAFSKVGHRRAGASVLAAEHHQKEHQHDGHHHNRIDIGKDGSPAGHIVRRDGDIIFLELCLSGIDIRHIHRADFILRRRYEKRPRRHLLVLYDLHMGDLPVLQHLGELLLRNITPSVEAVTEGKDQKDQHHPDQYVDTDPGVSRIPVQVLWLLLSPISAFSDGCSPQMHHCLLVWRHMLPVPHSSSRCMTPI